MGEHPGVASATILFQGADERVMLEDWQPNADVEIDNPKGLELLVINGGFTETDDALDRWSWLRLPAGQRIHAKVGPAGARVWYMSAPLLHEDVCVFDDPTPQGPLE